jgi:hypothetical protein
LGIAPSIVARGWRSSSRDQYVRRAASLSFVYGTELFVDGGVAQI